MTHKTILKAVTITPLMSSTKRKHPYHVNENAALRLPTQQSIFQMNKISQNPNQRSRVLPLAILKSVKISFELSWFKSLLLSLEKDLGISVFILSFLPTAHMVVNVTSLFLMAGSFICRRASTPSKQDFCSYLQYWSLYSDLNVMSRYPHIPLNKGKLFGDDSFWKISFAGRCQHQDPVQIITLNNSTHSQDCLQSQELTPMSECQAHNSGSSRLGSTACRCPLPSADALPTLQRSSQHRCDFYVSVSVILNTFPQFK